MVIHVLWIICSCLSRGKAVFVEIAGKEVTCRSPPSSVSLTADSFPTVARLEFSIRAVPFRQRRNRLIASRASGPCKGRDRARYNCKRSYPSLTPLISHPSGDSFPPGGGAWRGTTAKRVTCRSPPSSVTFGDSFPPGGSVRGGSLPRVCILRRGDHWSPAKQHLLICREASAPPRYFLVRSLRLLCVCGF